MSLHIKNKNALVTGGANGLGFHYAVELLRNDAKCVAILDLPNANGAAAVAKLEKEFGKNRAVFLPCDVTNADQLTAAFEKASEDLKGLDIVINNAGIANEKQWELTIGINYTALVRATYLAMDLMGTHKGGKGGTLVNISSICGFKPFNAFPVYCGTKHAVIGFSRCVQRSYDKTGVRVLVMCPGVTDTQLAANLRDRSTDLAHTETDIEAILKKPTQTAEHVARAMVELIDRGENGTICVSENGEPAYAVEIPAYSTLRKPL